MRAYIIRRLFLLVPTLLLVTIIVFLLVRLIPGNVVDLMMLQHVYDSPAAKAEGVTAINHMLGLDVPMYVQYGHWVANILRGNFGTSLWSTSTVLDEVKARLPVSLELGILAIIIGQAVAIPIGIFSAIRQDTIMDYVWRSISILFLCIPGFWIGTMIMIYPSLWWNWSPPMQYIAFFQNPIKNLEMFIIPAMVMGLAASGTTMRMTRTMMLEVLRQDYIRTAWSKGLKEKAVVVRHALKNALIPVVTIIGMGIPVIISGTVIIERIFNLPGIGRLMLDSLQQRDYTMISGVSLFIAIFVLLNNLVIDVVYGYLDPRIKYR